MQDDKSKIVLGGIGLLMALILIIYLAVSVVPNTLVFLAKASSANAKVSIKNSLVMGEKVLAKADGKDKCVINVFALDNKGKGVFGRQVQLSGLDQMNAITDDSGKARFEMVSMEAKQYELIASVNGVQLTKKIKVTFR